MEDYNVYHFGHKEKLLHSNSHCGVAICFKEPEDNVVQVALELFVRQCPGLVRCVLGGCWVPFARCELIGSPTGLYLPCNNIFRIWAWHRLNNTYHTIVC